MSDPNRAARDAQIVANWHRLSEVYGRHAPRELERVDNGDVAALVGDWRPFAFACLARCHYTLQSMVALHLRGMDAACLCRVLYEHVATFSWLLIDPATNYPQLLRSEMRDREKMLADSAKHVRAPSDPAALDEMRALMAKVMADKPAPELPDRALFADRYWAEKMPAYTFFLRKGYASIWRGFSAHVHTTWMGLVSFVEMDQRSIRYGIPRGPDPDFVLALGVTLFCDALRICSFAQGWPPFEEIAKAYLHEMPFTDEEREELENA